VSGASEAREAAAIVELIGQRNWTALRSAVGTMPASDVAELLEALPKVETALLFRALPRELATESFAHLSGEQQQQLLRALTDDETRHLVADLTPDDRTHLLEELPGLLTQRLLNLLPRGELEEARRLLGYPPESVGRLMTPDYVAVRSEWTVAQALGHIRRLGQDSETINRIYVVDAAWRLVDDISLRRFILADPATRVEAIMDHEFVSLPAFADREEAVGMIQRYDVTALPIVDSDGVLVGIVTVDDVLDVAEEEATEDFHRVGSVEPIRGSLRETGLRILYQRRIGWLLALVFVNILSGAGIAYYEDTIAATVALVFFLPLLIGSAGNAGAQASTLMVRAMATGDVDVSDWFRLVGREVAVAAALGLTMAVAVSVVGVFRAGSQVAMVVATTMVVVVIVGSLVGMSLPFLLSRFRLDPATASAPLVTSIVDITGVLIYLAIASWVLGS